MRDDGGGGTSRGGSRRCPLPPSDPTAVRSPLPFAVAPRPHPPPPHSARRSPDGTARGAPGPGKRGRQGEGRGSSGGTHLRAASRGGGRPGRGEGAAGSPARPPQDCPGRPARPRSARAFPSCSICGRLTPSGASAPPGASVLWGGSVRPSLSAKPHSGGPLPALRRALVLSVAPPLGRSSQPGEGPVLRSHEGGNPPPLQSHPPSRPPLPGSAAKNGLECQARESVAPSRKRLPAAGALRVERGAGRGTCPLGPGADPLPLPPPLPTPRTLGIPRSRSTRRSSRHRGGQNWV